MSKPPKNNPNIESQAPKEPSAEQGLLRELWALLLVYGTLVILPLLTGIACES
jgi:hypothetical protein